MIQNQLYKRGANCRDIAVSLKELGDFESKKEATHASILQAIKEEKLQKNDVFMNVRMAQALDNENDTNWKEVKGMKEQRDNKGDQECHYIINGSFRFNKSFPRSALKPQVYRSPDKDDSGHS